MNSQPKWDIYESVVLLNGYLLACKKSEPRAYIIRRVSADLRAMAIHRGRKIDEIFRNENGISYQMQSMDSAYKGRKIYVPATKLFQETVSLYRNQNGRFQELLKEARYMIEHDIAHPAPNDTDVFVVDFNDCPDMSFARVNSLTYRGQAILIRPKWRDLYIALLKKLYADYSNEIDSVVGKVYGRASAPFVGNCHSISLMRSPGEFAPDRYVELNISATTVIVNIKTMLDICGTSYEDVNITYTKGNKDQMEELLKVQNIRTVFSAELLSIAGTIISDIFPNGLRKSSQIARKKFAAAYKNTTGRDFQDNIDLDALALQVGLEYEDKIYVPSKETKEFLKKLIDNIREQEYRLVYYEELYNAFSEQLSADKIFSAEMLKTVLEAVAPEMVFYKAYPVTYLSPDSEGTVDPEQLSAAITDRTRLVSIMFSNNEIGTIEPIAELARIAHSHGAIFHTDAVQAIAHTPIDVKAMGIDMLSASAHKFNGPKGVGFLYIRRGVELRPLNDGGAQEFGMRAGTENVASIVGMAKALEISCSTLNENAEHVLKLEHALLERLKESGLDFVRNGARNHIPGNISVSFKDADGEAILHRLDLMGICVSTGSACDSVSTQISHVLKAIKLEDNYARGTIRISFGKENTFEEADIIAESLIRILKK